MKKTQLDYSVLGPKCVLAGLLVFALLCITRINRPSIFQPPVKPGQVWTCEMSRGNPWDGWTQTNTVLEVRDGWVRYSTHTRGGVFYVTSCRVNWFRIGSQLAQEVQ